MTLNFRELLKLVLERSEEQDENVTAQLTLFSFISQFRSQWNLLFANVIIITIPPLVMYIFFQRQIVSGMTSGAIKG